MIQRVTATTACETDQAAGLLAYLQIELECGLVLDGITLRRTQRDAMTLSFPERRSRSGQRHSLVRPSGEEARRTFERAVFRRLAMGVNPS